LVLSSKDGIQELITPGENNGKKKGYTFTNLARGGRTVGKTVGRTFDSWF
jgi:hypothetical protein